MHAQEGGDKRDVELSRTLLATLALSETQPIMMRRASSSRDRWPPWRWFRSNTTRDTPFFAVNAADHDATRLIISRPHEIESREIS